MKRTRSEEATQSGAKKTKTDHVGLPENNNTYQVEDPKRAISLDEAFLFACQEGNQDSAISLKSQVNVDHHFLYLCQTGDFDTANAILPWVQNIDISEYTLNLDKRALSTQAAQKFSGFTGLAYALYEGNYDAAREFIENGANVNQIVGLSPWQTSPLSILAEKAFTPKVGEMFKFVLSKGGNIYQESSRTTALDKILIYGNDDLLELCCQENIVAGEWLNLENLTSWLQEVGHERTLIILEKYRVTPLACNPLDLTIPEAGTVEIIGGQQDPPVEIKPEGES